MPQGGAHLHQGCCLDKMALLGRVVDREATVRSGQFGLLLGVVRQGEARCRLQNVPHCLHDLRRVCANYARGHNACIKVECVGDQQPANVPGHLLATCCSITRQLDRGVGQVHRSLGALLQWA